LVRPCAKPVSVMALNAPREFQAEPAGDPAPPEAGRVAGESVPGPDLGDVAGHPQSTGQGPWAGRRCSVKEWRLMILKDE
jgi:hypothetical protein